MKNIPNILSFIRILLASVFPFLEPGVERGIFLLFLTATDFLDGFLARYLHAITKLGIVLDPIGDKLLALIAAITFYTEGSITSLEFIALFMRDISLVLFYLVMKITHKWKAWRIQSFYIGKLVTALQFAFFLCLSFGIQVHPFWYACIALLGAVAFGELCYLAARKDIQEI